MQARPIAAATLLLLLISFSVTAGRDLVRHHVRTTQHQQRLQRQLQLQPALSRLKTVAGHAASTAAASRQLFQSSTDETCPDGCIPGSCARDGAGVMRCLMCAASLVLDAVAGRCVCLPGRYSATLNSCQDCDKGFWCPGGTYSSLNPPARVACPANTTTLGKRSSSIRACVNLPGFSYSVVLANEQVRATLCPPDTYGPGLRKQRACVPCSTWLSTHGQAGSTSPSACTPLVCNDFNPCLNITNSNGTCIPDWGPSMDYSCGCLPGFAYNSSMRSCLVADPCADNPCKGVAGSTHNCTPAANGTSYSCQCLAGLLWDDASKSCRACPAGMGGLSCSQLCPAGTYQTGSSSVCSSCPVGTTSAAGAASCWDASCDPGTGGPGCVPCPPNTYQPGRLANCQPCPAGLLSPMGSARCFDTRVAVGAAHSCAVVGPQQQVICDGKKAADGRTIPPANLTNVTSLCAGFQHTCAVSAGRVLCWGDNSYNQSSPPATITDALMVRCGELVTCVLTASRRVACWGKVQVDTINRKQVLASVNLPAAATANAGQLSVGWHHVCVASLDPGFWGTGGSVYCAGYPAALDGLPSDMSTTDILSAFWAVVVMNVRGVYLSISGFSTALGIMPAAATGAAEIVGGSAYALARMPNGSMVFWGAKAAALGVPAGLNVTSVVTYDSHLCVRTINGSVLCYGADTDGQLLRESFAVAGGRGWSNQTGFADSGAAAAACAAREAQLATLQQLQRDYRVGAQWCGWGYTADKDANGKSVLAYPMQTGGVAGCSEQGAMLYSTSSVPVGGGPVMAVCYGQKPPAAVPGVLPFSNGIWSILGPPDATQQAV